MNTCTEKGSRHNGGINQTWWIQFPLTPIFLSLAYGDSSNLLFIPCRDHILQVLRLNMCILHELQVPLRSFLSSSPKMDTVFLLSCALQNWTTASCFASYCTYLTTLLARTEKIIIQTLSIFYFKFTGFPFGWMSSCTQALPKEMVPQLSRPRGEIESL